MPAYQANDEGFKLHELHNADLNIVTAWTATDTGFDVPKSGAGSDWLLVNLGLTRGGANTIENAVWRWIRTGDIGVGQGNEIGWDFQNPEGAGGVEVRLFRNAARRLFMRASDPTLDPMPLRIYGAG